VANITIENIDLGSVVLEQDACQDAILRNSDADDPDTFVAGTILARNSGTLKLEPYNPGGSTGLNIPVAVLTYDVGPVPAVTDVGVRVLTAGKVSQRRLKIHGGTPVSAAHLDLLRSFAILPIDVVQLGKYDNPA
jgi:hypothetical protein